MGMLVSWAFSLIALISGCVAGTATHYGTSYQGGPLSCDTGYYDTDDPGIVAVGWESPYECGDKLIITGAAGTITATVQDRCGGCGPYHLDLSEAGQLATCGFLGVCDIVIMEEVEASPTPPLYQKGLPPILGGHAPGGTGY